MSADYSQFNILSPPLWIKVFSASSVTTLVGLGVISVQPAQANLQQQVLCLEQNQSPSTDLTPSCQEEPVNARESTAFQTLPPLSSNPSENLNQESPKLLANAQPNKVAEAVSQPIPTQAATWHSEIKTPVRGVEPVNLSATEVQIARQPVTQLSQLPIGDNSPQEALTEDLPPQVTSNRSNSVLAQLPYSQQILPTLPVPALPIPTGSDGSGLTLGQIPSLPQPPNSVPPSTTVFPGGGSNYNPALGQYPYYPQTVLLVPVPATGLPAGASNYNPALGQSPYYPQPSPQLPAALPSNSMVGTAYNPALGQYPYYPPTPPQLPAALPSNPMVGTGYNPQYPYYPPTAPQLPVPNPSLTPPAPAPTTELGVAPATQPASLPRSTALSSPSLTLQGLYIDQGDDSLARARLSGLYPLTPQAVFGATLDLTSEESGLADSPGQGLNVNELYFAVAPFTDLPNLRFVVGQLDLTSYFDRNSFAKDGATHFFNSVFQTNPALSTTGISSRPGALVNWTVTDNIEAKAAVFSSARNLGDFALDGFAGEIGIRYGNAIIRGTYVSDRDAGADDGFQEIFQSSRDTGDFGLLPSDREESYGINAEVFVPELNMGVFGRYGRYENRTLDQGGDTYSLGVSFLDVFSPDDRLGLAYGRGLSNDQLRRDQGDEVPDVLELFYDFRFLPNLRLGFTLQQRDGFSDTYGGFRVKTDFDLTPRSLTP